MSLTFGEDEAVPDVVPVSPPRIVTVPTTGPVADHVIRPELTVVPPVAVNVNVSVVEPAAIAAAPGASVIVNVA